MTATITWDALRDLAGFRAAKGAAVSVYLDLDPSVTPTAGDLSTRLNSLLSEVSRASDRDDLVHDQRKSLRGDAHRIRRYVEDDLVRDGAHGLAIFACELDNLWRALTLTESVADTVKVNNELYLTPLVPIVGRGEGALVAAVGRERGELYRLRGGKLHPVADRSEEQPGQHDQGGWSQARYQRHIEHLVQEHLQAVADELDRRVRRGRERIVVVAAEESRATFEAMLSKEVQGAIVGWTTAEAHAGPPELLAVAAPVLAEGRAREEREAIERWREEAGRNGRAAAGWAPTLEAASDGRVDLLLYSSGIDHDAWRCPSCGRVAAHDGKCPLDGTRMDRSEDGLDLAVHQTLANGGSVRAVATRDDLDPVEGIGALLRYEARSGQTRRPWRKRSSRLSVDQNASIAALSAAVPIRPKREPDLFVVGAVAEQQRECTEIRGRRDGSPPSDGRRRRIAITSASTQSSAVRRSDIAQPTTRLEYRSTIPARCSLPSNVCEIGDVCDRALVRLLPR